MATWLDLGRDDEDARLTTEEQATFVREVRELLDTAGTPGLDRENADAGVWAEVFDGALLIVLPLEGPSHASIQLQMTPTMILGTWDDKHYVWDSTQDGDEALRVEGVDQKARALALQWLDHEIRRPFVRRDCRWGPFRRITWGHHDDDGFSWSEGKGFLPVRSRTLQCVEEPAGFLDAAIP